MNKIIIIFLKVFNSIFFTYIIYVSIVMAFLVLGILLLILVVLLAIVFHELLLPMELDLPLYLEKPDVFNNINSIINFFTEEVQSNKSKEAYDLLNEREKSRRTSLKITKRILNILHIDNIDNFNYSALSDKSKMDVAEKIKNLIQSELRFTRASMSINETGENKCPNTKPMRLLKYILNSGGA